MRAWSAEGCGNTFLVLLEQEQSKALEFFDKLRRNNLWNFDSGLLLSESSCGTAMRVLERDGSESMMCGNGVRVVAAILDRLGIPRVVQTSEALLSVERISDNYVVPLKTRRQELSLQKLAHPFGILPLDIIVVAGEPHAVIWVPDVQKVPLHLWGPLVTSIANCTVLSSHGSGLLHVRTFERGVLKETQSCGTGAVAAATYVYQHSLQSRKTFNVLMGEHRLTVVCEGDGALLSGVVHVAENYTFF